MFTILVNIIKSWTLSGEKKALKESINKVTKHVLNDVYFNKVYPYRLINDYLQKFVLHNRWLKISPHK